jgi:hypothetical protein
MPDELNTPRTDAANDALGFGDVNEPEDRAANVISAILAEFPREQRAGIASYALDIANDEDFQAEVNA